MAPSAIELSRRKRQSDRELGFFRTPTLEETPPSNAERMLCSICQGIFNQPNRPPMPQPKTNVNESGREETVYSWGGAESKVTHHPTLESFRRAVSSGCFICTIVNNQPHAKLSPENIDEASWDASRQSYWGSIYQMRHKSAVGCAARSGVAHAYRMIVKLIEGTEEGKPVSRDAAFFLILADGRERDLNLPSEHRLKQIKRWIANCRKKHQWGCTTYRQHNWSPPQRLLNVGNDMEDHIKLEIVNREDFFDVAYVTMSHRWLDPAPPRLTRENLDAMMHNGALLSSLPQSFQDSVSLLRSIGISYLWIDSLCILQDSEEDFLQEAEAMGEIYAGSLFNIAASSSDNWKAGLMPECREQDFIPIVHPSWAELGEFNALAIIPKRFDASETAVLGSTLSSRGWIHQEVQLAPATLFCTREQLWWSCLEDTYCEAFPEGFQDVFEADEYEGYQLGAIRTLIVPELARPSLFKQGKLWVEENENYVVSRRFLNMWMNLIASYSASLTTKPDDRLVAIGGMVKLLQQWMGHSVEQFQQSYHSGMWLHGLFAQLTWFSNPQGPVRQSHKRWQGSYIIPSWSWASVQGPVFFSDLPADYEGWIQPDKTNVTALLATEVSSFPSSGIDSLGRAHHLDACILKLSGTTLPIFFEAEEDPEMRYSWPGFCALTTTDKLYVQFRFDIEEDLYTAKDGTRDKKTNVLSMKWPPRKAAANWKLTLSAQGDQAAPLLHKNMSTGILAANIQKIRSAVLLTGRCSSISFPNLRMLVGGHLNGLRQPTPLAHGSRKFKQVLTDEIRMLATTFLSPILGWLACVAAASPADASHQTREADPLITRANATVPLRIMPIGASVTFGVGSTTGNSYRKDLQDLLVAQGSTVTYVGTHKNGNFANNECQAVSGFVIRQIAEAAATAVPQLKPNMVLIEAGTNDCNAGVNVPDAGRNVSNILDGIYKNSPGVTVIMANLMVNKVAAQERCRQQVNEQYTALVTELQSKGAKITLADMRGQGGLTTADLNDTRHPNDAGYVKMANIWMTAIQKVESEGLVAAASSNGLQANGNASTSTAGGRQGGGNRNGTSTGKGQNGTSSTGPVSVSKSNVGYSISLWLGFMPLLTGLVGSL
ncbi:hypothetical protein JX265_011613 [Neoarthrinium moseri]|uniref:SGNH hydrolase-type esterase domain-containing protein n=1 Tax=Neoarthrinium moseri TaxID=1658444 RepID=A0A9P9WC74_9PEZI|nr:hypothetical protein JX265_011613 [Neoarthrinium moseri]